MFFMILFTAGCLTVLLELFKSNKTDMKERNHDSQIKTIWEIKKGENYPTGCFMTLEKLILLRRQTKAKINEINLQLSWTV